MTGIEDEYLSVSVASIRENVMAISAYSGSQVSIIAVEELSAFQATDEMCQEIRRRINSSKKTPMSRTNVVYSAYSTSRRCFSDTGTERPSTK
eukprot:IDg18175t1